MITDRALLVAGADIRAETNRRMTPLLMALKKDRFDVLIVLSDFDPSLMQSVHSRLK